MAKEKGKDLVETKGGLPPTGEQSQKVMMVQHKTLEEETNTAMALLIPKAGTIQLTKEQEAILYAPVNEEDIEIRPEGLIYLPWREYEHRMRKAFGSKWTMIPGGNPQMRDNLILQPWWLIIDGCPYGHVYGEQKYISSNPMMSYGDALEGAKSNALMRLCKGMGISTELWKPSFIREWKDKYAETYWDEKKKKTLWRKKGTTPESSTETPLESPTESPTPERPKAKPTPDINKQMKDMMTSAEIAYANNHKTKEEITAELQKRGRIYGVYAKGLTGDKRITPEVMHQIRAVEKRSDKHGDTKEFIYNWENFKRDILNNETWKNRESEIKTVGISQWMGNNILNKGGK